MIFKDWLESDQRLEGYVLQIAVTKSIESLKSVTPPSSEEVTTYSSVKSLSELADSQSVKPNEGGVIERGSTTGRPHLN